MKSALGLHGLLRAFRAAKFAVDHLPERIEIWRGTRLTSENPVDKGISWTRDRDVACVFAMADPRGIPVVYRRIARRVDVLAHMSSRNEDEIIITPVSGCEIDGDVEEWRAAFSRVTAKWAQGNAEMVRALKAKYAAGPTQTDHGILC